MAERVVIDENGQVTREQYEPTAEELETFAERRQYIADRNAARAAARQALSDNLSDLQANENSMPVLKAKVNYLLEQVRLLRGVS